MKKKKVWSYYCDYCKKANCSAPAIAKHEKHCTMNPNRVCRLCAMIDNNNLQMNELLSYLPNPEDFKTDDQLGGLHYTGIDQKINEGVKELEQKTDDCPMCIFSALRQSGCLSVMTFVWDYQLKLNTWWSDFNLAQAEADERSTYY